MLSYWSISLEWEGGGKRMRAWCCDFISIKSRRAERIQQNLWRMRLKNKTFKTLWGSSARREEWNRMVSMSKQAKWEWEGERGVGLCWSQICPEGIFGYLRRTEEVWDILAKCSWLELCCSKDWKKELEAMHAEFHADKLRWNFWRMFWRNKIISWIIYAIQIWSEFRSHSAAVCCDSRQFVQLHSALWQSKA